MGHGTGAARPTGFEDAFDAYRATFDACLRRGIEKDAILSAVLVHAVPHLMDLYGPPALSAFLARLADEVAAYPNGTPHH